MNRILINYNEDLEIPSWADSVEPFLQKVLKE